MAEGGLVDGVDVGVMVAEEIVEIGSPVIVPTH